MTTEEATFLLLRELRDIYSPEEAGLITDWVMEAITGSRKAERMIYKKQPLTAKEDQQVQQYLKRLLQYEPVQYILQEAWFYGMKFHVNPHVLIPRPETEELAEWIIKDHGSAGPLSLLDIGTGSGCIAISLKKKIPAATVAACDISEAALAVAKENAALHSAAISFIQLDFLNEIEWEKMEQYDIMVSNPPYIPQAESHSMNANVVKYEPGTALFVPDDNALIFYEVIARFGHAHLKPGAYIYAEIHESLGQAAIDLFLQYNYTPLLKKDMQGKDRMIRAVKAG
ncbi:MAG TPA: peptide chain release factor N(5)-glutamine methyltransferase [Chitinophagaceae bacterium]|nr:peptide chain release factor N(5)-glutamine methyltransferase [Chitinophagaceae bacterium]